MKNSIALKEERAEVLAKLEEIKDLATSESRDLTDDENVNVDAFLSSIDKIDTKIERAEKVEESLKRAATLSSAIGNNEVKEERKMTSSFKLSKALNQYVDGKLDGVEAEMHQEAKRNNPGFTGLALPTSVLAEKRANPQLVSNADELIATEVFDWMGTLQARLVMGDLATFISGLSSNVQLPVLSGTTAGWGTEVADATKAATDVGGSTLVPHKLGSYMDISKMLMAQTSGNIEAIIREDMNNAIAAALENAILSDSDGSGASPLGVFDQAGQSIAGGTMTLAKILEMESDIATNNAEGTCYITSPLGRSLLKALVGNPGITGSETGYGQPLWRDDNTMNGYFARATSNISDVCTAGGAATSGGDESGIVFGQWRDLVVGQFGSALDVVVDPYSQSISGEIRIVINSFWDTAFRRANSFCRGSLK
ncbi:MAG: phage major capsid protein [Flavobacteriaceae bacterium]|nr:phage major capsid protein [Flavobacteriaceae bacterium]